MTRLKTILRLIFAPPSQLLYIRRIKKSRLFDRQFYLDMNPGLHWLFRYIPEHHFVLFGEMCGLCPNPDFSPRAYLRHSPDVARTGWVRPFDHYIRSGRYENRLTRDLPVDGSGSAIPVPVLGHPDPPRARRAIVLHMYYHDLWEEFLATLTAVDVAFDLIVTLTCHGKTTDALAARIGRDWPGARVVRMPNHGRDIFPFVHLINAGWLEGYDAVCKLHTKKSPHRRDGERWRRHLISGILPGAGTGALLQRFLDDPEAALWVADGQHYDDARWWGSNFATATDLLQRLEIAPARNRLSFPAGSIYWVKPQILEMVRGCQLEEGAFAAEKGQTDGTTAHAMERVMGILTDAAGLQIRQTTQLREARPAPALPRPDFVSAFYLPQFHPVPENDAWWGKGYTEWNATSRARPQFAGHAQPVLPGSLGFYDLRVTEVMGQQAAMARAAGIDAFCVYHYWFHGRRILEAPVDRLLARPGIDFPFYLCWANESWRRNWDGLSGEVLLPQTYADGFAEALAESLLPYFADPRYQRPDGTRPRFVIYRPGDMPDPADAVTRMRATWRAAGAGEVELGAVLFHVSGKSPVPAELFDFWVEMPPHGLMGANDYLFGGPGGDRMPAKVSPGFRGLIYDYDSLRRTSLSEAYFEALPAHTIAGIMPRWDNTARRGPHAHIAYGANPARFARWLRGLLETRLDRSYRRELFINAWNEWAEKAMLEPDTQYHTAYLAALRRHL